MGFFTKFQRDQIAMAKIRRGNRVRAKPRRSQALTDGQRKALIKFVKKHKELWKKGNEKYRNVRHADKLWREFIAKKKLDCTVDMIKQTWRNFRCPVCFDKSKLISLFS